MKKLLAGMLATMMLLSLGTVALADDETVVPESEAVRVYTPGTAPAQSDISSVTPALHGVLLAMDNQGMTYFAADRDSVSWEMLYNLLSMYGQMDDRAYYEDEMLVLPGETVMDYSSALFAAPLSPDTMPEELSDRMRYEAESDEYRLYCGSDDLSQVFIDEIVPSEDGILLSGRLVYMAEDELLSAFTAELIRVDNMFGYRLARMEVAS